MTDLIANSTSHDEDYYTYDSLVDWVDEWTFKGANTATYTHKIHRYPAMFIPQLVRKIIDQYSVEGETILDIFNGSGSTTVECCVTNRNAIGIEINPLANLITKVKTTPLSTELLSNSFDDIESAFFNKSVKFDTVDFKNIDFWFTNNTQNQISKMLFLIEKVSDIDTKEFLKICLSEIIREVSVCRHSGFKMHRDKAKIDRDYSNEIIFNMYKKVFVKNSKGIQAFSDKVAVSRPTVNIIQSSTTAVQKSIPKGSVDLIITSPPYGDSGTTVAYGQFSRLSSQWLGLELDGLNEIGNLDKELLGGRKLDVEKYENLTSRSITLNNAFNFFYAKINESEDLKEQKKLVARLNDVMSFYFDLDLSLKNGAVYLKNGRHFILVTGSRVVKLIKLHTDTIIAELAEAYGLELTSIFYRNIPNKRMPSKVSATNIVGEKAPTMTRESIIILRKS